jgi:hypothetical protein
LAQEYDAIRSKLQKGDYRTRKMNTLVTQIRALSDNLSLELAKTAQLMH